MLTDARIRSLKPAAKRYRAPDTGGLYVEVQPSGAKYFRQNYRFFGASRTHTLGEFPALKLARARFLREKLKEDVRQGRDPSPPRPVPAAVAPVEPVAVPPDAEPERETDALSWRSYAARYVDKREREGAAPKTLAKLRLWLRETSGVMGDMPIHEIGAKPVIEACRDYEEQGKLHSAQGARTFCSQVFRFAIAHGDANFDPAAAARDALARPNNPGYPGITDPRRVGELMRAIRSAEVDVVTRVGLMLLAYLFPRGGELRQMRWDQIDGDVWLVPAAAMKMTRDHVVPLPRQAKDLLRQVKPVTGRGEYILQSRWSRSGKLSENTFGKALTVAGIPAGEHVPHGFRITASTTLYEAGWNGDWIERQLAHVEGNKVKGAYNKALHIEGRKEMMQWYADWLDEQAARQ